MQETDNIEKLIDIAMLLNVGTFNNVNLVNNGLSVKLGNGQNAVLSVEEIKNEFDQEKIYSNVADRLWVISNNEKIKLENVNQLKYFVSNFLPDVIYAKMLTNNVFMQDKKLYKIKVK